VAAPIQRLHILLRLSLLALALLSVVGRPLYSTWCETHQLGHALAAIDHQQFRQDSRAERQLDEEHARGAHGLLHNDDGGVYADIATVVAVPDVHYDSVMNPPLMQLPAPAQRIARLLRPPIA